MPARRLPPAAPTLCRFLHAPSAMLPLWSSTPHMTLLCRVPCSSMRSMSGRWPARFPCASGDYMLLAELGLGVTATVYLALCKPLRRKVAVKLLDLEAIEQAGGLVSAGFWDVAKCWWSLRNLC
jgi:hypothetical protein